MLSTIRTAVKGGLGAILRRPSRAEKNATISWADVQTLTIVRPNARIGNQLFLLPLLDAVHRACPRCAVNLVVGARRIAEELLAPHPALGEILEVPKLGRTSWQSTRAATSLLRAQAGDAVIDPTINSTTSRLVTAFARARHKVGFDGPDQWLKLSYYLPLPASAIPAWKLPLEALNGFTQPAAPAGNPDDTLLPFAPGEVSGAGRELAERQIPTRSIAFFCGARGAKRLPRSWWRNWVNSMLHRRMPLVEILPGEDADPISNRTPSLFEPHLRQLAAKIRQLSLFVSCDTGPMHLAAAAGTPISAFFSATDPATFRPWGHDVQIIDVRNATPDVVVSKQAAMCERLGIGD